MTFLSFQPARSRPPYNVLKVIIARTERSSASSTLARTELTTRIWKLQANRTVSTAPWVTTARADTVRPVRVLPARTCRTEKTLVSQLVRTCTINVQSVYLQRMERKTVRISLGIPAGRRFDCIDCPAGSKCPNTGMTDPEDCGQGFYSEQGQEECLSCEIG